MLLVGELHSLCTNLTVFTCDTTRMTRKVHDVTACLPCITCRAGTVIINAEEPCPLCVFRDSCQGNDQSLHGDRPHWTIPTRKTTEVQRVLRERRQVCQLQNHIDLTGNNQMTHCHWTELIIKFLKFKLPLSGAWEETPTPFIHT